MEFVTELLEDGDLLEDELAGLWDSSAKVSEGRIDMDAFVQLYSSIDNLFEEDEDGDDDDEEGKEVPVTDKDELVSIFNSIATDGMLSKKEFKKWEEVDNMMSEGLLGDDEFEKIWTLVPKESKKQIKLEGFLAFNAGLDDLFDFEDLEDEVEEEDFADTKASEPKEVKAVEAPASSPAPVAMIDAEGLSPPMLFAALADADGFIGKDELQRWGEFQEMIAEGDLGPAEVEGFLDEITKDATGPNKFKLNQEQFVTFYNKIDSLFEEDGDDEQDSTPAPQAKAAAPVSAATNTKADLLAAIDRLNRDEERLPCGLEATEKEQAFVLDFAIALESDPTNLVKTKAIQMDDVTGKWDLLYSSSAAMAFNGGLSGLGGSVPNGKFGGLTMELTSSKIMTDLEYIEHIKVIPDSASFDVTINGDWELRSSISIFTGEPSIVLQVVPEKVSYGPTSTKADHWKSLGPTNMLDISYLDKNLRVMRGNTNTDSILVFKRTAE